MSDNTNYMNTYVNLAVETVHNYLNEILQLKTQLSLLNSLVSEKDQAIAALTEEKDKSFDSLKVEIETLKANQLNQLEIDAEMQRLRDNAASWEFQYNSMAGKVSHMDTLSNQYNELQAQFINQTFEFEKTTALYVEMRQKVQDYEQRIELLNSELTSANKKIDRLSKKEEKKVESAPIKPVAFVPPKVDINKEETKSTLITQKSKTVVVEKHKETDDDF